MGAKRRPTVADDLCAGGVLWRRDGQRPPRLAVVHRPKYDDWSLPKGHVEDGETMLDAAVREVVEETGCCGLPIELLTATTHAVGGAQKYVLWWSMTFETVVREPAVGEIGDVRWLTVAEALATLSYDSEREVVRLAERRWRDDARRRRSPP